MIAATEEPPQGIVLNNISWRTYKAILREIGERHIRLTYDNGDLEIMTPTFAHENVCESIGRLIFFLALETNVRLCSGGSTTLKNSRRKKGLEPDRCFWIKHERQMRGKKKWKARTDPPPDLAVEVDITHSSLNRRAIFGALGVPELWHYDGKKFRVLVLDPSASYRERSTSVAFPELSLPAFAVFVGKLGSADEVSLIQEFVNWVRAEVVTRKQNGTPRKNGRRNA